MRVWTFQSTSVAEALKEGRAHRPTREGIFGSEMHPADIWVFDAYDWGRLMGEKMTGTKWPCLPAFAWTMRPDVRTFKGGKATSELRSYALIELEVPEGHFVLSSYEVWEAGPFRGAWIEDSATSESNKPRIDTQVKRLRDVPEEYLKNWERAFDESFYSSREAQEMYGATENFKYQQALIRGIDPEWVKSVRVHKIAW